MVAKSRLTSGITSTSRPWAWASSQSTPWRRAPVLVDHREGPAGQKNQKHDGRRRRAMPLGTSTSMSSGPTGRGRHPVVGAGHHHFAAGGIVLLAGKFAGGQHVAERGGQDNKAHQQHQRVGKAKGIHGEGESSGNKGTYRLRLSKHLC